MRDFTIAGSRVVVESGLLDSLASYVGKEFSHCRAAIITDANVGALYAPRALAALASWSPVLLSFPAGEVHKTRTTWARLTDELLAAGLGRDTIVVALGGGVVGDIAGFVAATYLRGVPVVQVPTSLVAMIDAALGGKTGVDTPAGKNLVGAFHPPELIAIDPDLLRTLPERERQGGLAEALKHGVIADADYFRQVASTRGDIPQDVVLRSIEIKTAIVNDDPRERGRRKTLNFGHTLGHAVEAESGYALGHGEAVAIGMVLEARLGERIGITAPGTSLAISDAAVALGLPVTTTINPELLVSRTRSDKKKRGGRVEYALPSAIGHFDTWATPVDDGAVLESLRA